MRYLIFAAVVVGIFTIFVTVFAASADKRQVRNLPKLLWVAICLLLPGIGGLLYLVVGRPVSDSPSSTGGAGRRGQYRTTAPDDDPEFLRNLADRLNTDEADPLADPDLGPTDPSDEPGSGPNAGPTSGPNDK
jgi:hypothetical protein